jgi:hypothetical protein
MNPVVHFEIPAEDLARARAFYANALGWNVIPAYPTFHFAVTTDTGPDRVPRRPGAINGGLQRKDADIAMTRLGVQVPDLEEALRKVVLEGGRVLHPPKDNPGLRYAIVADTEGNEINLIERRPARAGPDAEKDT